MADEQGLFATCVCKKDIKVKTVIIGFPGIGLTGSIAASHISEKLDLETIGFIRGPVIPPITVFLDGLLRHPYRIMGKEGQDIAVFIGESPVSPEAAFYIAEAILKWAEEHGRPEIICLDGFEFHNKLEESQVFLVAEPELKEKIKEINVPPLKGGYITGFAGAILNEVIISDLDGYAFLVGTRPEFPDPGGAAALVETINKLKGLTINVDSLLEEEESIKKKLQELAARTQEMGRQPATSQRRRSFYT